MTPTPTGTTRSRVVEWEDPHTLAAAAMTMSGPEFFAAMAAGDLPRPPVAALLDFTAPEVRKGHAAFTLVPAEFHYNPIGTVHGGVISTLLDSALGCAVHSRVPEGSAYTTLELKVNFVRPVTVDTGPVRAEATVIHVGKRTATAEGRLVDADGRLYAHATTTCLVFEVEHG